MLIDELLCIDGLEIIGDLSILRGTILQPGEPFVKSWEVRNTGSCSWDQSYTLQFFGGSAMSGKTPINMDAMVSPDMNKTLSVAMVAPMVAGTYYGMWQLIGPQGETIGRPLEVEIVVPQGSTAIVSSPTTLPPATKIPTIPPSPTRLLPATKIPTIPPSPTPLVPHTFTPIPPVTEEPCARPSTVTTIVNGTVRNGPGSYYEVLYTMESGQTAVVTGRYSGTANWWRIDDPLSVW